MGDPRDFTVIELSHQDHLHADTLGRCLGTSKVCSGGERCAVGWRLREEPLGESPRSRDGPNQRVPTAPLNRT